MQAFYGCEEITTFEFATEGTIESVAADAFDNSHITMLSLTTSSANSGYFDNKTLTIGDFSGTFFNVIYK